MINSDDKEMLRYGLRLCESESIAYLEVSFSYKFSYIPSYSTSTLLVRLLPEYYTSDYEDVVKRYSPDNNGYRILVKVITWKKE